jgi:Pyruvate/2-oxoacid:ferredoxin oxidoreductase gamma subunit
MVGYISRLLSLPAEAWDAAIDRHVPKRFQDLNREAFARGRAAAEAAHASVGV